MKTFALMFLILATPLASAADGKRKLTIEFSKDHSDKSFAAGESIAFEIVLQTLDVEDQNQFEGLCIDDWRYDTPNYFDNHRSPNVVLHVEQFDNSRWEAIGFRASSQGGGADLEKLNAQVDLFVGGDEHMQQAELYRLLKRAETEHTSEADLKKKLQELQVYSPNKPGKYRITATYTGLRKGSGRLLLTSGPVEVTVKEAKP